MTSTEANSINAATTGIVGNTGTSFTATAATQYNVLVGGSTSSTLANVAPSATSGVPLISGGSSSNPSFGTAVVAGGGTGATTLTGVLVGNGTSAVTATAITEYNVITGGASNAPNSVAPSATSGVPLVSNGSSSQPSFTTAVVAGGGTGLTTTTAYGLITGGTTSTGNFQNAGTGTSGQIYQSGGSSSLGSWVGAGTLGSLVLIQSQTASSSASLTFTTGITSTYNTYYFVFSNYLGATNTENLYLQISTNSGSSYITSGYDGGYNSWTWNSGAFTNANTSTGFLLAPGYGNSNQQLNGSIWLQNMTSGSGYPQCHGTSSGVFPTSGYGGALIAGLYNTASTTVNALRVISASGNLAQGTFTLYGLLE
jgi:hypothetical protein